MVRFYHHHQLSSLSCTVQGNSTTQHTRDGAGGTGHRHPRLLVASATTMPLIRRMCVCFVLVFVCLCVCVRLRAPHASSLGMARSDPPSHVHPPPQHNSPRYAEIRSDLDGLSWYFESTCPPPPPPRGRVHKRMGNRRNPKSKPHSQPYMDPCAIYAYIYIYTYGVPASRPGRCGQASCHILMFLFRETTSGLSSPG